MAETKSLLIELGTEELPPKALNDLAMAFRDGVRMGLEKRGIGFALDTLKAYWTPRRLAILVDGVETEQPDQPIERRGPALAQGFDANGNPSKALTGFAASCGVTIDQLQQLETDKGAWYVYRSVKKGETTAAVLPAVIEEALKQLPIPKPMRWGDHDYAFVRPAHWLVVLLGERVVPATILGLKADRMSRGHRFHHPQPVWINDPHDYVGAMRKAYVIVDAAERRARIRNDLALEAGRLGGEVRLREELLDEVVNLNEWPCAIACAFDAEFLAVPAEALMTTMEQNQKFFPVLGADGALTECFIGIANIESKDPAEVRKGYERVIRPRFADAQFFYDEDLKTPLAGYAEQLKSVTYQAKLGSVWDKCARVAELARVIAGRSGVDAALATKAAALSKADLMTRMVGEFPELQGVMGRYYATAQGEHPDVAVALDEFYAPRQAGTPIAASPLGRVLAIAEKIDTLAGSFAIGQKPTGSKDPFSLRRNALGLARTLVEAKLDLDLNALLLEASARFTEKPEPLAAELYDFILERLRGYYADQGIGADAFDAVAALKPSSLHDFDRRVRAVVEFVKLPEAASLAAANKRIANILRQAQEKGEVVGREPAAALFEGDAERHLDSAVRMIGGLASDRLATRDYVGAFKQLASLRPHVDTFFDQVMVMVEDAKVRSNRLALLNGMRQQFLAIADIGALTT